MSSSRNFRLAIAGLLAALALGTSAQANNGYPGIGRDATPKEVKAWDIDVRPDFKGLPEGSGS
ncbi:MAG: cytochrome C, partial [Janthinobacterium sp.]